jgi:RNA polymerase sigma factor (TIGR02999 family)
MSDDPAPSVTHLVSRIAAGDRDAKDELCQIVYDDLKKRAADMMRFERGDHTLQPTALVHEAMMRIFGSNLLKSVANRALFYGAAARAMRQVLVDHARERNAAKRAGRWKRSPLDEAVQSFESKNLDLIELNRAIEELAKVAPRQYDIVQLRFFADMPVAKIARMLRISTSTVEKDLKRAREFMASALDEK